MITFKHFQDRPAWAVAAGYDFNIFDCMSEAAGRVRILVTLIDFLEELLDSEVRHLWFKLPFLVTTMLITVSWPLLFWIFGLVSYFQCLNYKRKYSRKKSERVQINLRNWLSEFDRRELRGRK